jgi:2-dehydropantoate 2-reductase
MGDTAIAPAMKGEDETRLMQAAEVLTSAGLPTRVEKDVDSLIWSKLLVNVGINPLTAITRLRNGGLLDHPGTAQIMEQAVAEAARVASAKGVKLLYADPLERVRQVARVTSENVASMLQDVLAMRPTEIEAINGAISAHGRSLGLPTPVNDTLTGLVKTIEASYGRTV